MFKVGDIVEITEESDATGMLAFKKGKGYSVLDWRHEFSLVGSGALYLEEIELRDESGRDGWYSSGHFKLKEKEGKKVETLFKKGQVVWDLRNGRGVVVEVSSDENYPVKVKFDLEDMDGLEITDNYTADGRYASTQTIRSLYFSEPKIEAATEPLFEPVLKKGQPVILTRLGLDVQMLTGWVHEEHQKDIEIRTANDLYITYSKDKWVVHCVGEKIVFN